MYVYVCIVYKMCKCLQVYTMSCIILDLHVHYTILTTITNGKLRQAVRHLKDM